MPKPGKSEQRTTQTSSIDKLQLKHRLRAAGSYRLLEQRLVFDGAAVDTASEVTVSDAPEPASNLPATATIDVVAALASAPVVPETAANVFIFIDANVTDVDLLAAAVSHDGQVVILDSNDDGLEQIAKVVSNHSNLDAIHIVSHGSEGQLILGNDVLDATSMQGKHLDELTVIGDALSLDGDILIYGCDFTAGEKGLEAAMLLGGITGADIAASADVTGATALGGDWDLETTVGAVQSQTIEADQWQGVLAPLVINDLTTGVTALDLAQEVVGEGVTVVSANFSGVQEQAAVFSGALDPATGMPGVVNYDNGIVLSSGFATDIVGNNESASTTRDLTSGGDPTLDALNPGGQLTQDAAILEIQFIPDQSEITLQYVFGSEEYPEYVFSNFNDTWAIFVNGVNIALAPNGLPLGINTVNDAALYNPANGADANDPNPGHNTTDGVFESAHESLYVNNPVVSAGNTSAYNTQADGFTIALSVQANVNANQVNTIRVALADTGDGAYDSWLLLRGDSLQTSPIARPDVVAPDPILGTTIDVLANDDDYILVAPGDQPLTITQINGVAISPGNTATLSSGATVTLNADNTLHVTAPTNGTSSNAFTYTIFDGQSTSTGVVTIANTTNDAPVLTPPAAQTVNQDDSTAINGFNLYDIDAGYSDVNATLSVSNGTIDITGFAGLTVVDNGTDSVQISGPIVQIKNALNSIIYSPDAGYTGSDTLNITVNDLGNTGAGGALTDSAAVAITVSDLSFIPKINLDPTNISGGADDRGYETTFSAAAGTPVALTAPDISVTDSDSTSMQSATISILAVPDGNSERLTIGGTTFQLATNQTSTVTLSGTDFRIAYNGATRVFSITENGGGAMPIAAYEALLASATYSNVATTPATTDRYFSISVNDGVNPSNVALTTINVRVDSPPSIDLDTSDNTLVGPTATDDLETNTYTGGSGWIGGWTETGETTNATAGDIQLVTDDGDSAIRITDTDGATDYIQRSADLSGVATATLSLDFRNGGLDNTSETVQVQISSDGVAFDVLDTFDNTDSSTYVTHAYDISSYISANTTVRLTAATGLENTDFGYFDNIAISTTVAQPTSFSTTYFATPVAIASTDSSITDR